MTRSARARLTALRNEFADDDVQRAEEDERGGKRESVRENDGIGAGGSRPDAAKTIGERRFAERTDRQTGKRDAELHAGNHALQVAKQGFDNFCAGVATGDELAYARKTNGDEREFRSGEEAIQGDKRKHADKSHDEHRW